MKKYFAVLLLCVCAVLTLVSCSSDPKRVKIVYHANGEVFHTSIYTEGQRVSTISEKPERDGFVFNGWYYDEGTWEYAFDPTDINRDFAVGTHKLYARFEHVSFSLNEDERSYTVVGALEGLSDTLVIPSTYLGKPVTAIKENAFADIDTFTSVSIPDTVVKIGQGAFRGCDGLLTLTLPNSNDLDVGNGAFAMCKSLTTVNLGSSLKEIPGYGFEGCTALTSVTAYAAETVLGSAFKDCTALSEVNLPDTLKKINLRAFEGCTALTSLTLSKYVAEIGDYAFFGCTALESITFKGNSGIKVLGNYALQGTRINTLALPSLTRIGEDAFTSSLASLSFGNQSLLYVSARAFASLSDSASVCFGSTVEEFHGAILVEGWSEGRIVTILCENGEILP